MARKPAIKLPSGLVVHASRRDYVWLSELCPARDEHDPKPADFRPTSPPSSTHVQRKHPVCGLWTQWEPR